MSTNQIKQNIIINSGKRIYKIICMIVIWEIYALTLDDHVLHPNTSIHHLLHLLLRPSESGISDNSKLKL
jgi:hypothetical protein